MDTLCINVVILCSFVLLANSQDPKIVGKLGEIVGNRRTIPLQGFPYQTVHQYLGIPFAKPPVGDRRFSKPEHMTSLLSPFYAQSHRASCPQNNRLIPAKNQSEDCLHLNVYVPDRPSDNTSGHAVMVWMYGGGFEQGSAIQYDFSTLSIAGNIIVVTINYRLGIFGFLSTGDDNSRGNYGLWDQKMALQWVHDNIGDFGGDTQRVTIAGESAGSMSVIQHALTPENHGLFQRIIAQSGSMSMPSQELEKDSLKDTIAVAEKLGCATNPTEVLMQCLKEISFGDILAVKGLGQNIRFGPVVDGDIIKINTKYIAKMSESKRLHEVEFFRSIDILSGFNSNEGSYFLQYLLDPSQIENFQPTREEMKTMYLPALMSMQFRTLFGKEIMQLVEAKYTNWSSPNDLHSVRLNYLKLGGDVTFGVPAVQMARLHMSSASSRNFMYHFAPKPSVQVLPSPSWAPGANHADELPFILGAFGFLGIGEENAWENELIIKMMTYWSNFVKTGDPNSPEPVSPSWPEYIMDTGDYLVLDKNMSNSSAKQYFFADEAHFWLEVFPDLVDAVNESDKGSCGNGTVTSAASNIAVFTTMTTVLAIVLSSFFI